MISNSTNIPEIGDPPGLKTGPTGKNLAEGREHRDARAGHHSISHEDECDPVCFLKIEEREPRANEVNKGREGEEIEFLAQL